MENFIFLGAVVVFAALIVSFSAPIRRRRQLRTVSGSLSAGNQQSEIASVRLTKMANSISTKNATQMPLLSEQNDHNVTSNVVDMCEDNKRNLLLFESPSIQGLYTKMDDWQRANCKRFLSISIQKDGDTFCCVALTNPSEVVLVDIYGAKAQIDNNALRVKTV